ncbi:enoyl-CoA hydratase/carnithine racemase [Ereboglobus sp. PH5-10]|uniref:enoyl-CoA hydratase n=1 Tax=Ereboglobus sp. PH5-10 TaxID=2940629 RepID=UPI0024055B30|nr:enoyl-CoA hydratase [Ereboglobus sp. PH5-10]MDF9828132.1 enoyl-CoA hydratase/carnithine racemase [Ereboglobus sp. PH5-10]
MDNNIATSLDQGILQILITRPEKKNALTSEMYSAITRALLDGEQNPDVRVMLLGGAGGNFTAGNDLGDFLQNPPAKNDAPVFKFFECLDGLEKPLVAAVEGFAVGIGTTLLLHCDLVYAAPNARFILPFTSLGLSPEAGSSHLLAQRIGSAKASELILLGEPLTAEKALTLGLINDMVTEGGVMEFALARCAKLAAQPASAVRDAKALLKKAHQPAITDAIAREAEVFLRRLSSPEAKEALSAFTEKRKPDFSRFK